MEHDEKIQAHLVSVWSYRKLSSTFHYLGMLILTEADQGHTFHKDELVESYYSKTSN